MPEAQDNPNHRRDEFTWPRFRFHCSGATVGIQPFRSEQEFPCVSAPLASLRKIPFQIVTRIWCHLGSRSPVRKSIPVSEKRRMNVARRICDAQVFLR